MTVMLQCGMTQFRQMRQTVARCQRNHTRPATLGLRGSSYCQNENDCLTQWFRNVSSSNKQQERSHYARNGGWNFTRLQ
jgi:hypothetical protein